MAEQNEQMPSDRPSVTQAPGEPTHRVRVMNERAWLQDQIAAFERRLAELESAGASAAASATAGPPPPPPVPVTPPPPSPVPVTPPPPPAATGDGSDHRVSVRPAFALPAVESLLKWSGLVLIFLSAIFLVSTAIQRGWIGPEAQLVGAGAIGASLIAGGLVLGQRRAGWDVPLVSVGLAVLSATATAGWEWLELWSHQPWIIASFAVLGLAVALHARLNSPGVATTGMAATAISIGMLAPSLPTAAVLLAGIVVVGETTSLWRRCASLHLLTVAVGLASFGSVTIAAILDDEQQPLPVLLSGAAVTLAFWLMPLAMSLRRTLPSPHRVDWRPTADRLAITLPLLFTTAWATSSDLTSTETGNRMLWVAGFAVVSSGVVAVTKRFPAPVWVSQLMGGTAAATVGSTLLFDGPALLVGISLQAAGLLIFVHLVTDRWATVQSALMAATAGLLTLTGMVDAIEFDAPLIDDLTHLGVISLGGVWTWWQLRSPTDRQLGTFLAGLTFTGLGLWPVSALIHVPQGQALISAAWAGLGFAALIAGFARSSIRLLQLSLVTLAIVMVKLLTVDLAAVDTFWRVALFFVLGGAFLFASFRVGTTLRSLSSAEDEPGPGPSDVGPSGADTTVDGGGGGGPGQESGLAFQK